MTNDLSPEKPVMYCRAVGELDSIFNSNISELEPICKAEWLWCPFILHPDLALVKLLDGHVQKLRCSQAKDTPVYR